MGSDADVLKGLVVPAAAWCDKGPGAVGVCGGLVDVDATAHGHDGASVGGPVPWDSPHSVIGRHRDGSGGRGFGDLLRSHLV
jgi:hypothetical protein